LHYVLGMTVPEMGAELGVPEETVRSRLRLGRQRLRARLVREPKQTGARGAE
jgi:RNA polymerase sigma-70 factor (ECF subfamily)